MGAVFRRSLLWRPFRERPKSGEQGRKHSAADQQDQPKDRLVERLFHPATLRALPRAKPPNTQPARGRSAREAEPASAWPPQEPAAKTLPRSLRRAALRGRSSRGRHQKAQGRSIGRRPFTEVERSQLACWQMDSTERGPCARMLPSVVKRHPHLRAKATPTFTRSGSLRGNVQRVSHIC